MIIAAVTALVLLFGGGGAIVFFTGLSAGDTVDRIEEAVADEERRARAVALVEEWEAAVDDTRGAAEEVAGYRRRPDLTLGLQYIQTGDALSAGVAGSGDDPLLLSLSFTLPVWPSSYRAAEREARHLRRAAARSRPPLRRSRPAGGLVPTGS